MDACNLHLKGNYHKDDAPLQAFIVSARYEIGYAATTYSMDIFRFLKKTYEWVISLPEAEREHIINLKGIDKVNDAEDWRGYQLLHLIKLRQFVLDEFVSPEELEEIINNEDFDKFKTIIKSKLCITR